MIKLVHSSISENGDSGWNGKAKAGDSTGKEVCRRDWYVKPWLAVIRHPNADVAARAARIACRLADSNLVGYDQSERNTLYKALKTYDFDVDKYILSKSRTECDCSSFVYAVYACLMPAIRYDGNAPATSEMVKIYTQWGFTVYTDSKFANDPEKLRPGDIVVKPGSHTAIVYDDETPPPGDTLVTYSSDIDKALTALAIDVICGHWGNGDDRKNNIYRAVQKKVNELLRG